MEALVACALLGAVLVPAFSAFQSHLAASRRLSERLETELALESLLARAEGEMLCASNAPSAGTLLDGPCHVRLAKSPAVVSEDSPLLRYEATARHDGGFTLSAPLLLLPPPPEGGPARNGAAQAGPQP